MTSEEYGYVSSTIVRQIATLGGDVSKLLPPSVCSRLRKKLAKEPQQAINDLPE
jgi:pantetheine-phosphate adenylyltransferase